MKQKTRLALCLCALAAMLAVAGSAAAVPRLTVGSPAKFVLGGSTVSVHFTEEKTDAAPARIAMYAPEGYTANGAALGQQIGTVHANFQTLATSPDAMTSVSGVITSEDPAKYASSACSTGTAAPGAHKYVWLLQMTVAGKAMNVPVFVDTPVPSTDPFAGNSQVRLTFCLASPYAQAGSARAPGGAKLTNLALTLNEDMIVNPSTRGLYAWRTLVTPYTANSATVNGAGRVEARAMVFQPKRLSLSGKVVTKRQRVTIHGRHRVRVTRWAVLRGRLLEGLQGVSTRVAILSGPRSDRLILRGTTKTSAGGDFTLRVRLRSRSTFQARVDTVNRDVTSKYCARRRPASPASRPLHPRSRSSATQSR